MKTSRPPPSFVKVFHKTEVFFKRWLPYRDLMMLLMFSPVRHDAGEGPLSLEGDDDHAVDGRRHQDML